MSSLRFAASLLALAVPLSVSSVSLAAAPSPAALTAPAAAPLSQLVSSVDIPYDRFQLDNGLTVLVHSDHKAPVVAISVWYGVGSKNEPKGKTGFAHLFEHLMFYGSEHHREPWFDATADVGASDVNGSTWFDRTNYFETVPVGALDRFLMLESDRMGYLLGAVTQATLDAQRAVVKNEKRQRDNSPFGLLGYEETEGLYPPGHPYHHLTIGSMEDLDQASLADVQNWFHDHYAPNNVVLVLSGDIDLATAKAKVAHWFAAFPAGPKVVPVVAPVRTLPAPVDKTIHDRVATTRLFRMWAVPGLDNPDSLPLRIGATVLGGLNSARLTEKLVRGAEVAVGADASADIFAQAGQFEVSVDVKPGVDKAKAGAALDAEIARLLADGPSADELQRAATVYASGLIHGLQSVNGKADLLAESLLYQGDPSAYRKELARIAALTPTDVRDALRKWISRPVLRLTVEPGTRTEGGEHRGGDTALAPAAPTVAVAAKPLGPDGDRSQLPALGQGALLDFPKIEHARLSNGMTVYFARRAAVPVVDVRVAFDAGFAADPQGKSGTASFLLNVMDEGTESLDASALAIARERLGASVSGSATPDRVNFQLDALTPNLGASIDLLADYIRHPALKPDAIERVRVQQLTAIDAERNSPRGVGERALYPLLYGPGHPYGAPPSGLGDPAVVKALTRDDLSAWHHAWLRPDKAQVYVVGDTTLAQVLPLLERSLGSWTNPAEPAPTKTFSAPAAATSERVVLIDRPASPQSLILGGELLKARGIDDLLLLRTANDVIGGDAKSRLFLDLRERKGWSYGAGSAIGDRLDRIVFRVVAPVQTDKTGPSLAAARDDLVQFLGAQGTQPDELARATTGVARSLPGEFETTGAVLDGIVKIIDLHRPEDYYVTLADRLTRITAADLDQAARNAIDPKALVWVVVGDAAKVKPQLDALGLPVEVRKAGD